MRDKEESVVEESNENDEERRGEKGRREENGTVSVKRRCDGFVSVEAFDISSQGRDLESCGDLSWGDLLEKPEDLSDGEPDSRVDVLVVPDVTDVLVCPSSVVTEFCDSFFCCKEWEFVELQSFSFSKKRAHTSAVTQEEVRYEGSSVKVPPLFRRRKMPPTPLQNSYSSFGEEQEHIEVEGQMWSAKDRTIIAKTKPYLEESKSLEVEIEELESLLGPDYTDVGFRRKGCAIFQTFSTDGPSEFLVVSRSRWDK